MQLCILTYSPVIEYYPRIQIYMYDSQHPSYVCSYWYIGESVYLTLLVIVVEFVLMMRGEYAVTILGRQRLIVALQFMLCTATTRPFWPSSLCFS